MNLIKKTFFNVITLCLPGCNVIESPKQKVKQKTEVTSFHAINISGSSNTYITQNETEKLIIEGPKERLQNITTRVKDNMLILQEEKEPGHTWVHSDEPIIYRISVKNLDTLEVNGNHNVAISDLKTPKLNLNANGRSTIAISGTAHDQVLNLAGSISYNGENFVTKITDIQACGSVNMQVNAKQLIKGVISGSSSLSYRGDPQLALTPSGPHSIKKLQ